MKNLLKLLLLALLSVVALPADAQMVPSDFYGLYSGQAQVTSYSGSKPEKTKSAVSLLINMDSSQISLVGTGGVPEVYPVSVVQIGSNIFLSGHDSTTTFSARLQPKGKAGKYKMKGVGGHGIFGFSYISDASLSLKQIPI